MRTAEAAMTSKPPHWPWYFHLVVVLFCFAMSAFYVFWAKPGPREEDIGLVVALVLLAALVAASKWTKRRRRDSTGTT
jgi:peptidoglycan/LPS O-acetylase OafA/YrhL